MIFCRRLRLGRLFVGVLGFVLVACLIVGTPGLSFAAAWGKLRNPEKFVEKIGDQVRSQSKIRFADWDDAPWAIGSIAKLRGLGVVKGYGGDTYKPNEPVKQAEVLAMLAHALNMDDEAKELAEKYANTYAKVDELDEAQRHTWRFRWEGTEGPHPGSEEGAGMQVFDAEGRTLPYVPVPSRWALGYMLLAVDQGWIKPSECNPQAPASRQWVSMVLVRALGREKEALERAAEDLHFADSQAIKPELVGYVAEAVSMGIFKGYDDNTLKPNKPVTRAEMAVILDRVLGKEMPEETPYIIVGEVQEVTTGSLTVKTRTGKVETYTVSSDALIVGPSGTVSIRDISAGDKVEILSNGQGVALVIRKLYGN